MRNVNSSKTVNITVNETCFILTMRNVNHELAKITVRDIAFYINYEECKFHMGSI